MAQYKTVAGPVGLTIGSKDSYDKAVRAYAEIIQKETVGGWELAFIQEIPVIQKAGCLASLFGNKGTMVTFNMLVFKKED